MSHSSIEEFARKAIRAKPNEALLEADSVTHLSSSILESILADEKIRATESTLFQVLLAWAGKSDCAARQTEARNLTKCLRLERISPSQLTSLVEPSGLVSQDQLMRAYKVQATQAEEKYAMQYDRMRRGVVGPYNWQGFESSIARGRSGRFETALLQSNFTIHSGIWKWSVKVEELCRPSTWIGVAFTSHNLALNEWLGKQMGGWIYGSNGSTYTAIISRQTRGPLKFPVFKSGNVVHMTLDLTGRGALFASVDGGANHQLFSDMLDAFGENQQVGFLPAVYLKSPGRVRFLGLEEVSTS
jgi:hypothetical protein